MSATLVTPIARSRLRAERGCAKEAERWSGNRVELKRELESRLRGDVRFSDGDRALYATDASNYRHVPIGVVMPRTAEDVIATIDSARKAGAPVLMRGGGTSLAGQCCNVAVVLDSSRYLNHVLEISAREMRARVEPGTVLDTLRDATNRYGLTFGPDPATHSRCTIGGMIGNNSCGVHSVMAEFYGPGARTEDNVDWLDVVTYDGTRMRVGPTPDDALQNILAGGDRRAEIYSGLVRLRDRYADLIRSRFPAIPRRVSGYNLEQLLPENGFNVARALVGSEGTCVAVLEAGLILIPSPRARALLVLAYPTVYEAGDHVPVIRQHRPLGLEGLDERLVRYMVRKNLHPGALDLLPEGKGFLLVELGGETREEAVSAARDLMRELENSPDVPSMRLYESEQDEQRVWAVRESGLGATAFVPGEPDTWPGWEDSAVPPDRVGEYLRDFHALLQKYDYDASLYGHFGQGCLHCRLPFDLVTAHGIENYEKFTREAAELVTGKYGGALSGEHGDGQSRADLLEIMYGPELVEAFREFKRIWDPDWKMNPGRIVDPRPRTADLRLGADYNPEHPRTHFSFPDDTGDFSHAALRCVGVGKCRREAGGTMCPSWRVTHEEKHTTRGRAHMLFEMLQGDVVTDGWRSREVKESLDLCLSCKGCKSDCPVNVDMATYKAEFLSHYYAARVRPRQAYAFGLIPWWAKVMSAAPRLFNTITSFPPTGALARTIAGISQSRDIPRVASRTFTDWFNARRTPPSAAHKRVLLWPDTFNNHFYPSTLVAAVEALEHGGCEVVIPRAALCCGRPLYDYGMLSLAKRQLRQILDSLGPEIRAGMPVIGLEPSCVSVFRDEMLNLLPSDEDAARLSRQTFTLGEFLVEQLEDYPFPRLSGSALLHGHCHHKAVLDMKGEHRALERMGLELEVPDSGCCGMAGGFGFEREKYGVSVAIGEQVLLPAVRAARDDTMIVTDGFSCREQIRQCTNRQGLHLAEVIQLGLHSESSESPSSMPERSVHERVPDDLRSSTLPASALVAGAGALLAGGLLLRSISKRRSNASQETPKH